MGTVVVSIDISNRTADELLEEDWYDESGRIIIDEAYLKRHFGDDSFYVFDLLSIVDTPMKEMETKAIPYMTGGDFMKAIEEGVRLGMEKRGE